MKTFHATLMYIIKDDKILLGYKKRGFGAGFWNGIGGKIEQGETALQAAIRETQEEIGITPINPKYVAHLEFDEWFKGERARLFGYVFFASDYTGVIADSDEMLPKWFEIEKTPYDKMLPDNLYWLPKVLAGEKVKAKFVFTKDFKIISHQITQLD